MEKQIEKQDQVKELREMEKQENVRGQQENEQEQQETKKQGQAKEPEQEEMKKQEEANETEQQEMNIQEQVQEPEESKKQVEKQEQEREEREQEQEPEEPPNPPPKKTFSPPHQAELRHAKPSSPPKLPAPTPTPLPHQYSELKLPPSDSPYKSSPSDSPPHELEDDYDYKKSPFKDPTTTATTTAAANLAETVTPKAGITSQEFNNQERPRGGNTGSGRTYLRKDLSILKSSKRDSMVKRALLASRIFGFVFSLVSFSVMAADRDRGWALDSFYRYKEFRYCMAVNVIAFVYSGFQGYDTAYQLTSGKRKPRNHLRYYLDFSVDQMLTYLLISASSSAAVRIDDWQSNWGKDEFPRMARASVALSFLAFVALALSSLISGYSVFTLKSV